MSLGRTCAYDVSPKHNAFMETVFDVPSSEHVNSLGFSKTAKKVKAAFFRVRIEDWKSDLQRRCAQALQIFDQTFEMEAS